MKNGEITQVGGRRVSIQGMIEGREWSWVDLRVVSRFTVMICPTN